MATLRSCAPVRRFSPAWSAGGAGVDVGELTTKGSPPEGAPVPRGGLPGAPWWWRSPARPAGDGGRDLGEHDARPRDEVVPAVAQDSPGRPGRWPRQRLGPPGHQHRYPGGGEGDTAGAPAAPARGPRRAPPTP